MTDAAAFEELVPSPPLAHFVERLWMTRQTVQPRANERVLPTGTMQLVLTLDDTGRAAGVIVGPHSRFIVTTVGRPFAAIGVQFKPGGGFPFLPMQCDELRDRAAPLDAVWKSADTLNDRVWSSPPSDRLQLLERELLSRARGERKRHTAVAFALRRFSDATPGHGIDDLANEIGISSRRLADLFRREVGLAPKVFRRVRRFDTALRRVGAGQDVDWVDVALSCGYYDQAHFNHEFREFAGVTPTTYLRDRISRTHVVGTDSEKRGPTKNAL